VNSSHRLSMCGPRSSSGTCWSKQDCNNSSRARTRTPTRMSETMKPNLESSIYRLRFSEQELASARAFWRPICRYLQRYVDSQGTTLDLGAGYCHFINNIVSRKKLALDLNDENLKLYAAPDVRCIQATGADLTGIASSSVDSVF